MSKVPNRTPFKKRGYEPHATFNTKFAGAVYDIVGKFVKTKVINHGLTKGEEREDPLIEFFKDNLPNTYSVVKGEVVDKRNNSSQQMDVMIYDNARNIPFYSGGHFILPAEALLASIEIKSKLTQEETRKILKSVNTLKALKPFGQPVDISKRQRTVEEKVTCRYFHTVFAYDTDLADSDWAKKEVERIRRIATEEKIDPTLIDRVFVLNKGLLNPVDSIIKESKDNAESLLYFYMNLLNFIQRENNRRQTVPYLDYAGKLSKGWTKI
ncbi:DUF6602 domain-containing protein [Pontibacter virosus]|uniref:DUF6602 domain-containing protein n=1 Tax=Pontibacter virosus TaxID=1765052 RepID=A0A2U1AX21_9BACT|nr:DUF6602 domain-containing protein [Pontibacter virosus]PVY40901.1 hypothetical protein C8E01_106243 [Pontibacter virosus]